MEAAAAVSPRRGVARWAVLGGVVYVVLFVVGIIVLFSGAAGGDDPPAKVIQWYSDSGHRDRVNVGWLIAGLGIFFFLWFLAALRRAVSAIDADGTLTTVVNVGGGIYAALAWTSLGLNAGIRTMSDDTYHHQVFPELIHAADDAGYVINASGAAGIAAMIIAASLAFKARGVWPSWAGWLGIVVGVLSIGSIAFFPQFLYLAWVLIVSIAMFLRPARYGSGVM
jgi:hypothetical protein